MTASRDSAHFDYHTRTSVSYIPPYTPLYIVKLGFKGVYILWLCLIRNLDCGYSLEPPQRGGF